MHLQMFISVSGQEKQNKFVIPFILGSQVVFDLAKVSDADVRA